MPQAKKQRNLTNERQELKEAARLLRRFKTGLRKRWIGIFKLARASEECAEALAELEFLFQKYPELRKKATRLATSNDQHPYARVNGSAGIDLEFYEMEALWLEG